MPSRLASTTATRAPCWIWDALGRNSEALGARSPSAFYWSENSYAAHSVADEQDSRKSILPRSALSDPVPTSRIQATGKEAGVTRKRVSANLVLKQEESSESPPNSCHKFRAWRQIWVVVQRLRCCVAAGQVLWQIWRSRSYDCSGVAIQRGAAQTRGRLLPFTNFQASRV